MRRSLVLSLFACLVATAATSAAAPAASGICPGAKPAAIPCCPPPATTTPRVECCLPVTCCAAIPCLAQRLTIAATPDPSTEGRLVTISGRLFSSPAAGVNIALWQELPGQHVFRQIAQTTTDSAGNYEFVRGKGSVQVNRSWYVTASTGGVPRSLTWIQQVRAVLKLRSSPASAAHGQAFTLNGLVTPSHAGEEVALQEQVGASWKTIGSGRLGRGSTFSLRHSFNSKGVVVLRVVLAGDARNVRSASVPMKLHVR